MKTKEIRDSISKKRQELRTQILVWNQRVCDSELANKLFGLDEHKNKLVFCRQELKKLQDSMDRLNRPEHRQRRWNSQGFTK